MLGRLPRLAWSTRAWRLSIVCLLLGVSVRASVPAAPEYFTRIWTTDDGLPHNNVNKVLQDTTGFMWFATNGGLARFDGHEFKEMRPPAEFRSLGFNIRGLAEERPGELALLSTGNCILRLTGQQWSVHPATPALLALGDTPVELHVDPRGNLWVVTFEGRLLRWSPDGSSRVYGPFKIRGGNRLARRFTFATDGEGHTWIGADSLLAMEQDGEMKQHELAPRDQLLIAPGRNGKIWVCTERQLQQLDHGRLTVVCDSVPWQDTRGTIRHLAEDRNGALWIASSRRGLFRFADGSVEPVSTPFASTAFVVEDREGNLWIATDGRGVGQLSAKAYRLFNTASGLPQEAVNTVSGDPANRVWIGYREGGLTAIAPDGLRLPASIGTESRIFSNVACADAQGRIWFGGMASGLWRRSGEGEALRKLPSPTIGLRVLFLAKNGDMWFAADGGQLGFYHDDALRLLTAADGFTPQEIRAIGEDDSGNFWFGGRSGELLRWDGRRVDSMRGFPRQQIHAILAEPSGLVWIGTPDGLVLKDGDRFSVLTQADGLVDDIIQGIVADDQGRLWFAARRGLFYAPRIELVAAAHGSGSISSHTLGRDQGLVGLSPTVDYQPNASKTRDGRLWFATAQGAVVVDPAQLPNDLPPPPVVVDEVRLDGRRRQGADASRFPSGQHRLEFRLAALSYTAPESVVLRHQLEGLDPRWVETGSDRVASYVNLPPRDYRLRVIARNSAGQWNETGATLAFTVVPAWWETLWFRTATVALLLAVTAGLARALARRRLKAKLRRLEQEHALEKERARIARDLHDELGAGLTEVGLMAYRLVGAAPPSLSPQLSGLAWRTRRLATELSGIVWTMGADNTSLDRLAIFLRRYAERLFRNTGTLCLVDGVGDIPAVPFRPDPQHHVLAAVKEALNNILMHAQATEARVEMRYAQATLELCISDNGSGFFVADPATHDGNGLRNILSRVDEIGGTVKIESTPGRGTRIILRIPCPPPENLS